MSSRFIILIAAAVAFVLTLLLLAKPFGFLPRDGGKFVTDKNGNKIEINKNSNGKVTGVGLIMVIVFLVVSSLFFMPFDQIKHSVGAEFYAYVILMFVMMITGYLDDAAKSPWGELVKGILDLIIAIAGAVVFVLNNPTNVNFFGARFHNPVVLYVAPRTLNKGTDKLELQLPMYVGSVRVMLIAGHDGAYGAKDVTVPVQSPLMVVTTLPRVLGSSEKVSVPVNVFSMEEGALDASVSIKVDGPVKIAGASSQKVHFAGAGDSLVNFGLEATGEGTAHITVNASGAGHKTYETIALEVVNRNPETTK
jgi:hypothetical protein